jgi:midasin (ATPase involved in ribosome maturation)
MNIQEIKNTLNYLLDNNLKLVEEGKGKLAVSLIGHAGCGKTAIIKELAQDRGAGYTRLNLSELEEVGD